MSLPVAQVGQYKNITATGAVSLGSCQLLGFYVNSTTAGTLIMADGGASGTVMNGVITPAIGFHPYPANVGAGGLYATIANTLDVTFFFASGG